MITTTLVFLGVLGFLVVAHELGHFAVAKLRKVKVLEFGVGYPPRIFGFTHGDTTYTLNLLPLGGFVRMQGETDTADQTDERAFINKGPYTRLAILAAGAGVNAILPVFLLTIVMMLPQEVTVTDVVLTRVAEGGPAAAAGLQPGDIVRTVDGREIESSPDLQKAIQLRLGADSTWVLERHGVLSQVTLEPRMVPPPGEGATGVEIANARVSVGSVTSGSRAQAHGLVAGDSLVLVASADPSVRVRHQMIYANGVTAALASALMDAPGAGAQLMVLRQGVLATLAVPDDSLALEGASLIEKPLEERSEPIWRAFPLSFMRLADILFLFRNEISRVLAGPGSFAVAGPLGIAQLTGEVAEAGLSPLITWTALLSINLAIVNLLPIPALDGGRITFVLLELARGGRRLAPEKERFANFVGFVVLIGAITLVSVQDIRRLMEGGRLFGG